MSEDSCFNECWRVHHQCALKRIRDLEVEVSQLRSGVIEPDWMARLRTPSVVPCGDETICEHKVVLHLHRAGPTWASASDDPPTR